MKTSDWIGLSALIIGISGMFVPSYEMMLFAVVLAILRLPSV